MKVLFGVDGSDKSIAAVRFVGGLLSPYHDQGVLYFGRPQVTFRGVGPSSSDTPSRAIAAFAVNVFERATEQLPPEMRGRVETVTGEGKPARRIIEEAKKHQCQLITVAAQNASSRLAFFVGGVARTIANLSDIPVLLYRERPNRAQGGPVRVLYAVDNESSIDDVVNALQQFHWPEGSKGLVMHVMDYAEAERLNEWIEETSSATPHEWTKALSTDIDRERDESLSQLTSLREKLPSMFHEHAPIVVHGHVVEQVLSTIDDESIDLVVVGAPKLSALARMLGSTTEGLIHRAPCSILVVHPDQSAAG